MQLQVVLFGGCSQPGMTLQRQASKESKMIYWLRHALAVASCDLTNSRCVHIHCLRQWPQCQHLLLRVPMSSAAACVLRQGN